MTIVPQPALAKTMTSFVPGLVRRRLAQDPSPPAEPLADRCSAAVMFADISGFTALAERVSRDNEAAPEELADLLNRYFGRLIEIIHAHGGEVTKFAGDGILALWPIPERLARLSEDARRALGDKVRRAAQCALEVQEELPQIPGPGGSGLALGIGLGAGDVYSVHLGGVFGRWEFLLSGSPLVQMSLAKEKALPGKIVLSPEAWELTEGSCRGRGLSDRFFELESLTRLETPVSLKLPALGPEAIAGLKAYIPAAILSRLEAGHDRWLSEMRRVTVLFIKLPSYGTSITHPYARTLPEAQEVMKALQLALYHHAGSINKFNVDDKGITLVAALGLPPLSHRDDSMRGLHAALEMQTALRELGRPSAIGVATGRVFCGPIGHESQREYTVVGNDVNMAARMMQVAETRMQERRQSSVVLCDQATYDAVQAQQGRVSMQGRELAFRRLQGIQVKGRAEPVTAYVPSLGDSNIYSAIAKRRRRRRPLVGRDGERQLLQDQLAALRDSGEEPFTSVIFVEGEAGVGKSLLIQELLGQAEEMGLRALKGQGNELESTRAFHAWAPVFRDLFSLDSHGLDIARQRATVLGRLPMMPGERGYPALALRLSPLLNAVLPLGFPENKLTSDMPPAVRQRTTRLFLLRLMQLAFGARSGRFAPRVIVLEDSQWMDLASWELALSISRQVRPLLMVISSRTLSTTGQNHTIPSPCQRLLIAPRTIRLNVSTLEQRQVASLAGEYLEVAHLPSELPGVLHSRAGGVPLFVEEMVNDWRARGLLLVSTDRCELGEDPNRLSMSPCPEIIQKIIAGRLDRLKPDLQLVLKIVSLAGESTSLAMLKQIYPIKARRPELPSMLRTLVGLGFLRVEGSGPASAYRFSYDLLQEVFAGLLTQTQREYLQRLLAKAS